MNIKPKLSIALVLFFSISLSAQSPKMDSLKRVVSTGSREQQVDALNLLANIVVDDKPEEAKRYAARSIQLAEKINYKPGLGDAYNRIGIAYDISSKYDSSIYFYEKALVIYNDIKNLRGRGSALNNLGLIYWNKADYDKALHYFFEALKDFEVTKHDRFSANALNNIGLVYEDVKNFKSALIFHQRARIIYEKLDDKYLRGAVYNNLGNTWSSLENLDSSAFYYKQAIDMQAAAGDDYGLSIAYAGYATLLSTKGELADALGYFKKALTIKDSLNELAGSTIILLNMANIYSIQNNRPLVLDNLLKAKNIAEENGLKKEKIKVYRGLAEYYIREDATAAFNYFAKYDAVKDTVYNETSSNQINQLNAKYETGKKELQLKEQDLTITRKNLYLQGITAILLLTAVLSYSFYRRYRLKQQKKLQDEVIHQQDLATKAIIGAEENERQRIAAELHDGIGQMMSVAKMNLSSFEHELVFKNDHQRKAFENVISLVDDSCKEVRNVSHQMMPNALLKKGLGRAVQEFIDKIDSKVIKVSLHAEGLNEEIDKNIETVLYRVIQECVNNVLKHAKANHLDIALIKDEDGIAATIEDNGKGFNSSDLNNFKGIGLKNIISRIKFLKGTIDFDSSPSKGTLVAIHVPVK